MASFSSVADECANSLRNSPLLYIHCVSKEDFPVRPIGLPCVELVCRQVHISFVDRMAERRILLVPLSNGRIKVEDLFASANSPVLVSLMSSCDMKFTDPREQDGPFYECVLLWDFEIIPAPAAAVVRPKAIANDELSETLPAVDLGMPTTCNCFDVHHRLCLVEFQRQDDQESEDEVNPLSELLDCIDSESCSNGEEEDEEQGNSEQENQEEQEEQHQQQTVEYFAVVGSNWEKRYQDGLQKCYDIKVKKQKVNLRVEHEPDNIADCNALKFEVLCDGQWHIIGYCGVKKIPKLKRALHHNQVVSLELCNLRRIWYPPISEFRFVAGVNIVKIGKWEKDDPYNMHNSSITL